MNYLVIIILYLVLLLAVGVYLSKRVKSGKSFMVADRSLPWYINTGTIVATFVGSGSLIGGAALSYKVGMSAIWFDMGGVLALLALSFMAKRIRNFEGMTTPDILGARYNRQTRYCAAVIIILAETAIVGYQLRAGGYVLNIITGIDANVGMIITTCFIIGYTVIAGLVSVAYTDFIQSLTIVVALIVGLPFLFGDAGGLSNFLNTIEPAKASIFSMSPYEMLSVGLPTFCLIFVMQPIWQRIFASKSDRDCQKAVAWSVPFVTVLIVILVMFATVGSTIYTDINPDTVILNIAVKGLPTLIAYMVLCAGVAIIVSTGDSMLLSASSNIVNDFYLQIVKKDVPDKKVLLISRIVVIIVGIIAYVQVKFFPSILDMVFYAYTMEGGLAPALFAAFYWKRGTRQGGFASVIAAGVTTLIWEFMGKPYGIDTVFPTLIISSVVLIAVSLLTPAPDEDKLKNFYAHSTK